MRVKVLFIAVLLSISISSMATFWGPTGHRVVGQIAESYLSAKAKKAIKAILGDESVAMASTWADHVRSDPAYRSYSPWHYINLKAGLTHSEIETKLLQDTATNLYTKLNFVVNELKKKDLEADKKILYLRLLIHFVGDIHQPLHAGRPEDLGGNRIRVVWFGDSTNLHSMWDDKLPEFQKLSYTEFAGAINHTTKKQRTAWQKQPVTDWFIESYDIAQKLYDEITQPNQRLSYEYNFKHMDTMNQRLLMGGVRLAGLLNEIFG